MQTLNWIGKELGELLRVDARRIYTEAGGIGLFVDALDAQAAGYYRRFGFQLRRIIRCCCLCRRRSQNKND